MHHMTTSQQQASTTDHPFCFRLKTWSSSIENRPVQDATGHSFCEQKKIGGSVSVLDNDRKKRHREMAHRSSPEARGTFLKTKRGGRPTGRRKFVGPEGPPRRPETSLRAYLTALLAASGQKCRKVCSEAGFGPPRGALWTYKLAPPSRSATPFCFQKRSPSLRGGSVCHFAVPFFSIVVEYRD